MSTVLWSHLINMSKICHTHKPTCWVMAWAGIMDRESWKKRTWHHPTGMKTRNNGMECDTWFNRRYKLVLRHKASCFESCPDSLEEHQAVVLWEQEKRMGRNHISIYITELDTTLYLLRWSKVHKAYTYLIHLTDGLILRKRNLSHTYVYYKKIKVRKEFHLGRTADAIEILFRLPNGKCSRPKANTVQLIDAFSDVQ